MTQHRSVLWSLFLTLVSCYAAARADGLVYDARIAFIPAGTLTVDVERSGSRYELSGSLRTSAALRPFFSWSGRFAAVGTIERRQPVSESYLLFSETRGRKRVVSLTRGAVNVLRSDRESRLLPAPSGSDIMSGLFIGRDCYLLPSVHDGEDSYPIRLAERREAIIRHSRAAYYSGPTRRCDYHARDLRGRVRPVSVWLAELNGEQVPVRMRVAVPRAPDLVFYLRLDSVGSI